MQNRLIITRFSLFFSLCLGVLLVGVLVGQGQSNPTVRLVAQLGEVRPRGVQYDPNFERMAYVDAAGRLVLADGITYEAQHTIYNTGLYNAYRFSHNGRWLAVMLETRAEVFDAATGEKLTEILPDGALVVEGPIYWAEDDELISFNTQVRAPRELRRSENDTVNLPYIWDWQAMRRARASILPNRVVAQPFFDYKNAFVYGPNNVVIAGLDDRLDIRQVTTQAINPIGRIIASRNEPDPISVWRSAFGEAMYVEARSTRNLWQIASDATSARIVEVPLGSTFRRLDDFPPIDITAEARIIGEEVTRDIPELLRWWLGDNGTGRLSQPQTVELIDILQPVTAQAANVRVLLKITTYNELVVTSTYTTVTIDTDIALNPQFTQLTVRTAFDGEMLDTYDLITGHIKYSIRPILRETGRNQHLLTYNGAGDVLLNDYQRYDAQTGALISQDIERNYGFDSVYFMPESGHIVTVNQQGRWVWDFYTEQIINDLTVQPNGNVIDVNETQTRYLTEITLQGKPGREIYDVPSGDRQRIVFDDVPERSISAIYHSPSWQHFLVVYSEKRGQPYPTGTAIALYSFGHDGMRWLIAGDDLPFDGSRQYAWLDDETIVIRGERSSQDAITRIYGIDYHVSGLPACMVDAFPQSYTQWVSYWDYLVFRQSPDDLNRLAAQICAILTDNPQDVTEEGDIQAVLSPTPTERPLSVTATPSGIAGVPDCLTRRFPDEARAYAAIWRDITADLTPEELNEQERLLCANLQGGSIGTPGRTIRDPNVQVMLIDIHTQVRRVGGFIPQDETFNVTQPSPQAELVANQMRAMGISVPGSLRFSPDRRYIAGLDNRGFVQIYELLVPYDTLAAQATATERGFEPTPQRRVQLRPTATRGFDVLGPPRPTLTPTVTHTPPPTIAATAAMSNRTETVSICPAQNVFTMDNLPPQWDVNGRILLRANNIPENPLLVLQPEDGSIERDYDSLDCSDCPTSFDGHWVMLRGHIIARPDGTNAFNLEDQIETLAPQLFLPRSDGSRVYLEGEGAQVRDIEFVDLHTLQYRFRIYDPADENQRLKTYTQRLNLETGLVQAPVLRPTPTPSFDIDFRDPEVMTSSAEIDYSVMRIPFNTGEGVGHRYYLVHLPTQTLTYLARVTDGSRFTFTWHPLARALYLRYPDGTNDEWYRLNTATGQIGLMGNLPPGIWSRDGRYRFDEYPLSVEERNDLIERGEMAYFLQIWDSETGLMRRYCVPTYTDLREDEALWSPDDRYILLSGSYEIEPQDPDSDEPPVRITNYLMLDTQTGTITEFVPQTTPDFASGQRLDIVTWLRD